MTGPSLDESREHLQRVLTTLPWEALALSKGDPAIPTTYEERP
jgi:nicotinate phosphoribosyltransferase